MVSFMSFQLGDNTDKSELNQDPDQPANEQLTTNACTMNEGALKGKQYIQVLKICNVQLQGTHCCMYHV